jgi:hypothetical protein
VNIKRRQKRAIVIVRKYDGSLKKSPCSGCISEEMSKNSNWCEGCKAPDQYADRIEQASPHCPAIDYSGCYNFNLIKHVAREIV